MTENRTASPPWGPLEKLLFVTQYRDIVSRRKEAQDYLYGELPLV